MDSQRNFLEFLDNGVSPYHVVHNAVKLLQQHGFQQLSLADSWKLQRNGKYFLIKGYSSIIAFVVGGLYKFGNGYVIIGSHTDSPCLKVRPVSRMTRECIKQIAVDKYGGGIWRSWFDRGLSLAGLVTYREGERISHKLVDCDRQPLLCIPSLAIHLTPRDKLDFDVNVEEHLHPIFTIDKCDSQKKCESDSLPDHHHELLDLLARQINCRSEDIIDFDLRTYAVEPAQVGGLKKEFVFSGRLDNLVGVYSTLWGLINSCKEDKLLQADSFVRFACCFDHEEVGSESNCGAQSGIFEQVLQRISIDDAEMGHDKYSRAMANSFIISADQAHGAHPNFPEKHERNHRPRFDGSVVVKMNANQRYATNTLSFTILQELAKQANVKLTKFVVKNDSPCGSTIGPFISTSTGALTIDVGCPQFAMHSCRETGDLASVFSAVKLYSTVYSLYGSVRNKITFSDA